MSFTNFLELELLDHVLGNSAYPAPATVYVGLSTTAPNDDGTNFTEPVGGAYVRAAVTNNLTNWPAAVSGTKQNGTTITFPEATSAWGSITHVGIFDAAVAGNLLMKGALSVARNIEIGDTAQFPPNNITVTLD